MKVLVVDDDRITRRILSKELAKGNYETVEEENGSDALKHILSHDDIDLITLDVNMPKMNGYMACSMLRSWEIAGRLGADRAHSLPVVFVTGSDSVDGRYAGFEAGSIEFIPKGFKAGQLVAIVDRILKPKVSQTNLTAVIADSNPVIRKIVLQVLREFGVGVLEAANGREALSLIENSETPIGLLITDLKLPKLDGLELIHQVRSNLMREDLRIIGICPAGSDETVLELFKAGADDYLAKPMLREIIFARLRPHLQNLLNSTEK